MAEVVIKVDIIKDVIPTYPDLVSDNFKDSVINDYESIKETKDLIYSLREQIRDLENSLKIKEKDFETKCSMCTIVYETKTFNSIEATEQMKAMHRKGKVYI